MTTKNGKLSHEVRRERRKLIAKAVTSGNDLETIMGVFSVSETIVRQACKEHSIDMPKRISFALPPWVQIVDWTWPDRQIARCMGLTHQRVHQVRHHYGKIKASQPTGHKRVAYDNEDEISKLTLPEAHARFFPDMSYNSVHSLLRGLGIPTMNPHTKYRRDINWELPNVVLDRVWRLSGNGAANMRSRAQIDPAVWECHSGTEPCDPDYHDAVKHEERKAAMWRKFVTRGEATE